MMLTGVNDVISCFIIVTNFSIITLHKDKVYYWCRGEIIKTTLGSKSLQRVTYQRYVNTSSVSASRVLTLKPSTKVSKSSLIIMLKHIWILDLTYTNLSLLLYIWRSCCWIRFGPNAHLTLRSEVTYLVCIYIYSVFLHSGEFHIATN